MPEFRFDGRNEEAQRIAERQAALMVTRISDETRLAIRNIIVRSIREGIAPYDAARMIREMIGLNAPQAQAAANYRAALVKAGLSPNKIEQQLEKYVKKQIAARAKVIARTELMDALNEGALEAWKQAREQGFLGADAEKEWHTRDDEKTCPICAPMDGQRRALDADFETAIGPFDMPPAHPNCRCTARVIPGHAPATVASPSPSPELDAELVKLFGDNAPEMAAIIDKMAAAGIKYEPPDVAALAKELQKIVFELDAAAAEKRVKDSITTMMREMSTAISSIKNLNVDAVFRFIASPRLSLRAQVGGNIIKGNVSFAAWQSEELLRAADAHLIERGWHPYVGPGSTFIHEIAHIIQNAESRFAKELFKVVNGERTWLLEQPGREGWDALNAFMIRNHVIAPPDELAAIAAQVGVYAARNPVEFIAETYVGLIHGLRFSAEVMDLYAVLGGPRITR